MERLLSGFDLIEAPRWVNGKGLFFVDTAAGGVYCLDANGGVITVAPHRRGIGGLVMDDKGGIIVSGRNVTAKSPSGETVGILIEQDSTQGIVGFSDMTTDTIGRVYVGALGFLPMSTERSGIGGEMRSAPLYRIDLDGSIHIAWEEVLLTNGLAFNADGNILYHADSGDQTVYVYDVSKDGSLADRRPFVTVENGLPDGLALDRDGAVWLAVAHSGAVMRFMPDGSLDRRIDCPEPMTTSVCFGGENLCELFITTGSEGSGRGDAGSIYRTRVSTPGVPIAPARVQSPRTNA